MEKVRREGSLYTPDAGGLGFVDEVFFKKEYYTEMLKNNNVTAVLTTEPAFNQKIIMDYINAEFYNGGEPIIIVTESKYTIDKPRNLMKEKYDIINVSYKDIKELHKFDNKNVAFAFYTEDTDFFSALERAMLANKALLRDGYKPTVIIDGLEELYDTTYKEPLEEFFKEVFLDCISKRQNILFIAEWLYATLNPEHILPVNDDIIKSFDRLIVFNNLKDDDNVRLKIGKNAIDKLNFVIDKNKGPFGEDIKENLKKLIVENDDILKKCFLIDFENGTISKAEY